MQKREMTKPRAVFLILLSGLTAVVSALELHGWHVFLGLALVGVGLAIGFIRWSREE